MKKLPYSGQTFQEIVDEDFLYVDKTKHIYDLIKNGKCYFLSRPRRFGKSLLLSAMDELFQGKRELFRGLWIDSSDYDFKKRPVLKLNMALDCETREELKESLILELDGAARKNGVRIQGDIPANALKSVVYDLQEQTGEKIAVLIDEYDAPILDQIDNVRQAKENHKELRRFYVALKGLSDSGYIHFIFVTGVTKFAKASIFSGFNNLADLTLDPDYYGICGFTLEEFDSYFGDYLQAALEYNKSEGFVDPSIPISEYRQMALDYYDGYSWDGKRRILNPYSLINFLHRKKMKAFWFASGTPTFLDSFVKKSPLRLSMPDGRIMTDSMLEAVDVEKLSILPLLFQSGYLTIDKLTAPSRYLLREPNLEVAEAFNTHFLALLTGQEEEEIHKVAGILRKALERLDPDELLRAVKIILQWLPHQLREPLEHYYRAIIFAVLRSFKFDVRPEVSESHGDIDLLLVMPSGQAFVIEFKYEKIEPELPEGQEGQEGIQADAPAQAKKEVKKTAASGEELAQRAARRAMAQIKEKGYAERYRLEGRAVKLVGVGIAERTDAAVLME
jgi:hypothetical protein